MKISLFTLKLWGYSFLICLLALILIPVENCITYPIHISWIALIAVTLGCIIGEFLK